MNHYIYLFLSSLVGFYLGNKIEDALMWRTVWFVLKKALTYICEGYKGDPMKRGSGKCIKLERAKKHPCYVLITCDEPSDDGKMQVEMSYEGDATLAAYILQGAQFHISEQGFDGSIFENDKIRCLE